MRHILRKRLGAGVSGVIREISDVMARFVTYSVAVLVSTADGFGKFPTRAEIAAQFPLLLGHFLDQLDDRVMLQIGWSFNCFRFASDIALEKHPVVFSWLAEVGLWPVGIALQSPVKLLF
jgi:hypothetical protein